MSELQFPRRAESLNIYKPKTIELPRFHSKPKQMPEMRPTHQKQQSESQAKSNKSKQSSKMSKANIAQIVSKIKEKRDEGHVRKEKAVSHKKLTADKHNQKQSLQKVEKLKIKFKSKPSNIIAIPSKQEQKEKSIPTHARKFTTERAIDNTPKQFRSKSLKNAVKVGDSVHDENPNKNNSNSRKIMGRRKNITQQKKNFLDYPSQNTTQATNQSLATSEIDKKTWLRILEIIRNITIQPGNLDWPEQYIVMEKSQSEKNLYLMLDQSGTKIRQKIRKLLCLTRVLMYLYAGLILHQIDAKPTLAIFERLHQSYSKTLQNIFRSAPLTNDRSIILNRNNQLCIKMLTNIMSKRSVPQGSLLKNMLESSLKIQSLEFIEILDKTLKWEILKMPSYPYLPAPTKELFLVLDLDETLIHYDYTAEVFHVRPFAEQFIKKCSQLFEITIFTAAVQEYADEILDEIDPDHCISYKLYRNHLTYIDGSPVKDLSMLGRALSKTLLVDNIAGNYRLQPENGVQIRSWYDDDEDEILGKLYAFLLKLSQKYSEDIRIGIKEMSEFVKEQITKSELIYELKKEL